MTPTEIGRSYDAITDRWSTPDHPLTGLSAHQRAVQFLKNRGLALDAGCGCNGRLIDFLQSEGFAVDGVDVSERMIELARTRNPTARFFHADLCQWELPRTYDLITGWDSIWHVPLADQPGVLRKLSAGLTGGGVLIFTLGGLDLPGEVHDAHMGVPIYTATMGVPQTLAVLAEGGCVCRHVEFDQWPQPHVFIIAQKEIQMPAVPTADIALLKAAYSAFNARDIDAALVTMAADVRWPKAFKGGFVTGHEAVRAYWTEQWSEIDPHVEPVSFQPEGDGRVLVDVHQVVRDLAGKLLLDVHVSHRFTLVNGLIQAMEVGDLPA